MKQIIYVFLAAFLITAVRSVIAGEPENFIPRSLTTVSNTFMQANNINTVFRSDGILDYDKVTFTSTVAGFIWPAAATTRMTADFSSGLWLAAKYGPQRQLRAAGCFYNSLYTPGNIPVPGLVPPSTVCSDPQWRGYLVNLADPNLVSGGTVVRNAGGRAYTITYDAWSSWPVNQGAPYVEVNGIPGYQPGWNSDRPGIGNSNARPDEICFNAYMDYTNCTNNLHTSEIGLPGGSLPMGAEIQQISYAFSFGVLKNMYFIKWKIINKSTNVWDSTYIGIADDADVGNAADDKIGCDTTRDLGFIYNATNYDQVYGAAPPALGQRLLQGPLVHTGNPQDTARMPYGNLPGYKLLGMSVFNIWVAANNPCDGDPNRDTTAFNFMRGKNGCGNTFFNWVTFRPTTFKYSGYTCGFQSGWFDSLSHDAHGIQCSGPITMNPNDTQVIALATIIARGSDNFQSLCVLLSVSDSARRYYYGNFNGVPIGITSISTEVPQRFALIQNYPNPFNPSTKIKFSLPKNTSPPYQGGDKGGVLTSLMVYDVLGRVVTTLVNQPLSPGTYEVDFDGTSFPSGVYFYKITANDFSDSKKMILIK